MTVTPVGQPSAVCGWGVSEARAAAGSAPGAWAPVPDRRTSSPDRRPHRLLADVRALDLSQETNDITRDTKLMLISKNDQQTLRNLFLLISMPSEERLERTGEAELGAPALTETHKGMNIKFPSHMNRKETTATA